MPNTFVTVASFDTAPEAWIFRNRLADAGLNPIIVDEHTVNTYWLYANAIGGIKVQIPANELSNFHQISNVEENISYPEFDDESPDELETCPDCGSIEIQIVKWPKWFALLSLLFVGAPLPCCVRTVKCSECGFEQRNYFTQEQLKTPHFYILFLSLALLVCWAVLLMLGIFTVFVG